MSRRHFIAITLAARARIRAFGKACDGQIALIVGLTLTVLIVASGGAIDLMRAYQTRQQLAGIATLACQYASRPNVIQLASPSYQSQNGGAAYSGAVVAYINTALRTQKVALPQTSAAPFAYTLSGPADVSLSASMPTAFLQLAKISTIPIAATAHCYDSPAGIGGGNPTPQNNSPYVAKESFEPPISGGYQFYPVPGRGIATPTSSPGATPAYTGADGSAWYGTGYCLEVDRVPTINATAADGSQTAELDCDNGSGNAGNSAISTQVYLPVGTYELRYNYRSRVGYPNYDPTYLCGSAASDLSWANDANPSSGPVWNAVRTNQVNVYLDRSATTAAPPPVHTTIDGSQQLAGSNLIDMCVYSASWVERSVRVGVTSPDFYWLTFAADGQNDSYGGQIDNIRFCIKICPGTLQDNFPANWLAANNGGSNKVLFRDTFDTPAYTQDPYISFNRTKGGNLANSVGTSGTAQSGWPSQAASGWATGPYNQANVWLQDAYQGSQYVSMQGWNGYSTGADTLNRLFSRKFLLDPGYYSVSYGYISMIDFSATAGIYGTSCYAAPASGPIYSNYSNYVLGRPRYTSSSTLLTQATNILGVFMSHGQLVSTLNPNTAMGNASNGASSSSTIGGQASYTNPDGTVTTNPTAPPDKVSWTAYDATAKNPLIDTCGYAAGYAWVPRSATVKIAKPGWYWLTFSAQGDDVYGTGNGPAIDDVKLTALGSPAMMPPPGSAVAIPVPAPQPSATIAFNGFSIVADPLIAPAPAP